METININDIKDIIPYYKKKLRKQKRIEESQINYILQESDGFVPQEPNSDLSSVQDDIQDYNTIRPHEALDYGYPDDYFYRRNVA